MKLLNINYDNRVFGLDLFRAIAIIIVLRNHGGIIAGNLFSDLPSIPLIDGVELFFVLSGFLIGSILIKKMEAEKKMSLSMLLNFWKRRWFRTLPNYYLILLVNFLFVKYGLINGNLEKCTYKFLLFLQNFHEGFVGFFWESWSLSIEEWFYIFLPLFILLFSFYFEPKKTLIITIVLLIFLPLMYRIGVSDRNVNNFWLDVHFRKVVLTRLDSITFGVLAAYIKFYYSAFWGKYSNIMFIMGLGIIYANEYIPGSDPNSLFSKTLSFSITSFGAALLLSKADSIKSFKYNTIGKSITFISIISYSMYLVHFALVAQVIKKNFSAETASEYLALYILYWIVTIIVSTIIYKFYEKPITDIRDRV